MYANINMSCFCFFVFSSTLLLLLIEDPVGGFTDTLKLCVFLSSSSHHPHPYCILWYFIVRINQTERDKASDGMDALTYSNTDTDYING